jgi:hypothetical protein
MASYEQTHRPATRWPAAIVAIGLLVMAAMTIDD